MESCTVTEGYTATFCLRDLGSFPTFKEAFKAVYDAIMGAPSLNDQLFETVWIKGPEDTTPVMFYEARDMAVDEGWLVRGQWVG